MSLSTEEGRSAGRILSAPEQNSLRKRLSETGDGTAVATELLSKGVLKLTNETESLLAACLKASGLTAAKIVLEHLHFLRPGFTHTTSPGVIAGLLIDYLPDHATSALLIKWHPPLAGNKAVLAHVAITNPDEMTLYTNAIHKLGAASVQAVANDLLIALSRTSPDWIPVVIEAIGRLPGSFDLGPFFTFLFKNHPHVDALFESLKTIGKLSGNTARLADTVLAAYPGRAITALFALLGMNSTNLFTSEPTLEKALRSIAPSEIETAVARLDSLYQGAFWPRRMIASLASNPQLPCTIFFDRRFPRLAAHSIKYFDTLLEQCPLRADGTRRIDIIAALLNSPIFSTLDIPIVRSVVTSLISLSGTEDCRALQYQLLETVDLKNAAVFPNRFFELLHKEHPSKDHARRLLNAIALFGRYPFDDLDYLISLLNAADKEHFERFMLTSSPSIFAHNYTREKLLLCLAEADVHHFSFSYLRHRRRLTEGLSDYSTTLKETYKTAWRRLTFMEKIKGIVLFR